MSISELNCDRLTAGQAGELLTLQRAAFVTEARKMGDPNIPALTQTLGELREELEDANVIAMGGWLDSRLVASVRLRIEGGRAEIARLTVAPDQRDNGYSIDVLLSAAPYLPDSIHEVWVRSEAEDARGGESFEDQGVERQLAETAERLTEVYLRKIMATSV